ncbi:MAG TPA: cbb3-type cytochrome c oxidase subunit I [Casimicrobiaceae bacterium]|nr:cbb3-type cytochrome c oxidase subunit I [Casimicrobiaceae bacterium]
MLANRRLVLAHFWLAFGTFAAGVVLGAWQMWARSPLHGGPADAELYYRSVTAHGTALAYVFPTLIAMGFGYAVCASALGRPVRGERIAWAGLWLLVIGALMAVLAVAQGNSSVLYTFYPPLTASPFYYLGVVLVVVGSWFWVGLMIYNMRAWKQEHPGERVPLAVFGTVANALLWLWTSVGAALELLFQLLPVSLGWSATVDAGLARTLFSWTLHSIVYFWLLPAYVAFYALVPQAAGGRLYSDRMGRLSFVLFLVLAMPIGIHHLFQDPHIGAGFKFLHSVFTAGVVVPTLLTVFTLTASLEIAGRLRGGKGLLGWVAALPWDRPIVLATGLALLTLGLGGAGGIINMSYTFDQAVHNTQWITGHFHLIFAGTVVSMYFAIAYELWPHLTGHPLRSAKLACVQLWVWFVGMLVVTLPWHFVGLMGQPRRMAYYDYSNPALAAEGPLVTASAIGGFILLLSAALLIVVLLRSQGGEKTEVGALTYSRALDDGTPLPRALNNLGVWFGLMVALTIVNYGYPIAQSLFLQHNTAPPQSVTIGR